MKLRILPLILLSAFALSTQAQSLPMQKVHTKYTNIFDNGGVDLVTYDKFNNYVYFLNNSFPRIEVYDYTDLSKPAFKHYITTSTSNISGIDVYLKTVAVVGYDNPQSSGKLEFYDEKGAPLGQYPTGSTPKNVTFSPNGTWVLIANEGKPSDDYTFDPIGSVNVLAINNGIPNTPPSAVAFIDFTKLDTTAYDPMIQVYGNNGSQLPSQDLEPENVAIDPTSTKAFVTLQENNAVAIIDILNSKLDTVIGLGYKDHSTIGLDASDTKSTIDINTYNRLYGLYRPDGIASFSSGGTTYFITANEGVYRDYTAYSELVTISDFILDFNQFPNMATLYQDTALGHLKLTNTLGNYNNDFYQDSLFCYGGRSISIWTEGGQMVWDSGDEFEQLIAQMFSNEFNSSANDNSSRKSRSPFMGPEPECITIGEVDGVTYAFIGLKQMGGFMIYDLTDPTDPQFVSYELNRDFSVAANDANAGDLGISDIEFVPALVSPTGFAILFVANEVSGTLTTYEMGIGIGLNEGYPVVDEGIYPNPSEGVFNTTKQGSFKVYNLDGKLVKTVNHHTRINLSDQPDGIYIIKNEEGIALRAVKK